MKNSPCKSWLDFARMPIDWAALAQDRKMPTQKGDKRARWEVEKIRAATKRNQLAKRDAAIERTMARQKAMRRPKGELMAPILRAMEPGQWYARPDIRDMTRLDYGPVKGAVSRMVSIGVLEQARNPDWRPTDFTGRGVHAVLDREPVWLFRLTDDGVARRAALG